MAAATDEQARATAASVAKPQMATGAVEDVKKRAVSETRFQARAAAGKGYTVCLNYETTKNSNDLKKNVNATYISVFLFRGTLGYNNSSI